ncbi:hypothetical protein BJV82DRAFT_237352 [Fennellomyces sp. T-0311]|nr:hypothetical protein BJV82DRAFT_237352 [Fennellomyces sp. T-0311]
MDGPESEHKVSTYIGVGIVFGIAGLLLLIRICGRLFSGEEDGLSWLSAIGYAFVDVLCIPIVVILKVVFGLCSIQVPWPPCYGSSSYFLYTYFRPVRHWMIEHFDWRRMESDDEEVYIEGRNPIHISIDTAGTGSKALDSDGTTRTNS